ncbi:Uu.00g130640.m01.CDS01 [Anthostomella pinea]|uniref:Uu.00g130640.m01.CDS01 n=1 Tax=Anthostomella pinea TaxID=933095 RepID=A0AAI8YI33_9PEZI|nr:Uu.00g130640.m01.CDS01 [Anthostomella pinea]
MVTIGEVSLVNYTVVPPGFDNGLQNAPYNQWIAVIHGFVQVILPHNEASSLLVVGGQYSLIFAADTADTFWAILFLSPNSQDAAPSSFVTSFVAVPLITYLASAAFIVYVWGRSACSFRRFVYDQIPAVTRAVYGMTVVALNQLVGVAKRVSDRSSRGFRRFVYDQVPSATWAVCGKTLMALATCVYYPAVAAMAFGGFVYDQVLAVTKVVCGKTNMALGRFFYDQVPAVTRAICGMMAMALKELMRVAKWKKNTPCDQENPNGLGNEYLL